MFKKTFLVAAMLLWFAAGGYAGYTYALHRVDEVLPAFAQQVFLAGYNRYLKDSI